MDEKYFDSAVSELNAHMENLRTTHGIKPFFTRTLHWYDDPTDFFRLAEKAGKIANAFMAISDILHDMGCEAEDRDFD